MKVTIISQNIRCANDPDGHSIAERAPRIKALMEKYDADTVGFQEIKPVWLDVLNEAFSDTYEVFNQYRSTTGKPEGPALIWKKEKFECLEKGSFWLSDTPEEESQGWDTMGYPRNAVWAKLKDRETGRVLVHISTHFGFGDEGQVASAKVILSKIKDFGCPAVVTGDFNLRQTAPGYAAITEGLTDVNMATVKDLRTTFHAYGKKDDALIDYIFVTDSVQPLTYQRLTETYDGKFPSDHYGILGELEL
ncbi:MAG: endonuclease/exonuclease/phosphatase family protein [Clostridia bacterium]|nr:endonuclease/exonuclease/phosphatase family protein [Clostridia bacterium]